MKKKSDEHFFNNLPSLKDISVQNIEQTFALLKTNPQGLSSEEIIQRRKNYGQNIFSKKKKSWTKKIFKLFFNPFNMILLFLVVFSFCKDVYHASEGEKEFSTFIIISLVLLVSNIMNFMQEAKFSNVSEKLKKIIQTTTSVKRENQIIEIPLDEVVVGDIICLSAGDIIPADMKLFETKDFFVKETTLTGESNPIEKKAFCSEKYNNILEDKKLVFMGTTVVSGYAQGIVISVGNKTYLGKINQIAIKDNPLSTLQKGINSIAKIITVSIFIVLPSIVFLNFIKAPNDFKFWEVLPFALSTVLGLTPEMLPLIATTSFFIGMVALSKQKVIVKNLYSIQDFGAMNVLFTDKTGTLTEDKIIIDNFLDINNNINNRVLKYAYLNSFFQTGLKNLIDSSIIDKMKQKKEEEVSFRNIEQEFAKIDEIPFDFKRRIMSVIVVDKQKETTVITKGAIEEMLNICSYMEITDPQTKETKIIQIDKEKILEKTSFYNNQVFRVMGVAYKRIDNNNLADSKKETDMIMIGFLTLLDPLKKSAIEAIASLKKHNVEVKILTGDNEILSKIIASKINIANQDFLLGTDVDQMDDEALYQKAQKINIFAKLNPEQKARIVSVFKQKGNVVGYMGDGINDAAAMKYANLAISVDSGVDIAKESADIILLEKDLKVLENGILEGRRSYANMIKYIKLTLAANFGNILSILVASFCLPFIPLLPIQILFLNLIYDFSCLALPFDHVEEKNLNKPRQWNFKNIICFMMFFGTLAFSFDVLFSFGLYFIENSKLKDYESEKISLFQTRWFIFSIWTQYFTIYCLRNDKFCQSLKNSRMMFWFSIIGGTLSLLLPFIPVLSKSLNFENPFTLKYIALLAVSLTLYGFALSIVKKIFIRKNQELL
ncbi:magnesium-translocating P-type ATPase [Italian clover phyllody phytoplasma]|uniref:magnesium-translocating P-type ATPase n=1 Tax=Italian clover phyllody phytoplasma TaxID=1196420 RepID=UPI0002D28DCE|nr:magnesium-translocating P-type ATPase [Italian clover phyllody phytoplasma]